MLPKLPTLAVLWMVLGPAGKFLKTKNGRMLSKLQTLAVLWTRLGPARKMQNKLFFLPGPKPSTELPVLAFLTTVYRTASVGSSDPGFFYG